MLKSHVFYMNFSFIFTFHISTIFSKNFMLTKFLTSLWWCHNPNSNQEKGFENIETIYYILLKYILVSNKIKFDVDKKMILNGHDIKLKWRKPGVFVNMLRPNSQYNGKGAWQQIYPWPLFCFWPLTLTYTFLLGYEIHDHQKSLPLFQ